MDLRHSLIPDDLIEDLLHSMPKHEGPQLNDDEELPRYDYVTFMEGMTGEGKNLREHTRVANGAGAPNHQQEDRSPTRLTHGLG